MTKPWDDTLKLLVRKNPQALVSFVMDGAIFKCDVDRELKTLTIIADVLYIVTWQGKDIVLHVEFQRNHHSNMGRRLWQYNALTNIHTNLPVYSVVIYLVEDSPIVESPYVISLPNGQATQRLDFETIKLWEIPPEVIEQQGLAGLLPLLPLTKGGKKRETVDRMIKGLQDAGKQDLFLLGYALSALVFTADDDEKWLKERFFIMHDILKDTWVFQEVIKEGLEEGRKRGLEQGLEQGREQGLEQGREEALEQGLMQFVEIRFPTLVTLAKQVIEQKIPLQQLQKLLYQLYRTNTVEEAQEALNAKGL